MANFRMKKLMYASIFKTGKVYLFIKVYNYNVFIFGVIGKDK